MTISYSKIALFSYALLLIADMIARINSFIGLSNGSTEIIAVLNFITIFCFFLLISKFHIKDKMPEIGFVIFKMFLFWSFVSFVIGMFSAQDYWDWKVLLLMYSFSILVPFSIVLGLNHTQVKIIFKFIINKVFLFGFVVIPFALSYDYEFYARVVIGVSLFVLFLPYMEYKWRILIVVVALMSIIIDVSYRINTIRILFSVVLLFLFFGKKFVSKKMLNICLILTFSLPLFFLYLGVSDQFNIFQENTLDYSIQIDNSNVQRETNLSADTRTFLYKEVFYSMIKRNSSFIVGEGGGSAYETYFFSHIVLNYRGRYGSEVGFLNTLLYSGAIGVVLYLLMLIVSAYYAINHSKNSLSKMLGLFVAFHWIIFFIEDRVKLDMNYFFIWLAIGLCLSNQFRALTDLEVKEFFKLKT